MSVKSEALFKRLRESLGPPAGPRKLLLTVRATSVTRINIAVLRILLQERGERGMYLVVERADRHLMDLLEKQSLAAPPEVATSAGTGSRKILVSMGVVSPILFVEEVLRRLTDAERGPTLEADLETYRFLMVDNLASVGLYSSLARVEGFFRTVDLLLARFPGLRLVVVTARGSDAGLHAAARRYCDLEVDIPDAWLQ